MIFSRLFAPSHTSQNPEKRLEAIKNLSPEKPPEKTILHELAFNDADAEVSLAALEKLNSFVLWLKMSQIAKNERVQRTAQRNVDACLLGTGDVKISDSEKVAFLKESASADAIVQVVSAQPHLLEDSDLALSLVEKVAKPSFFLSVFLQHGSESLQLKLLATVDDIAFLQKLEKKTKGHSINQAVAERLAALKEAAEKPALLLRELTLCLSKLNALQDRSDVEDIEHRKAALVAEFTALMADAQILTAEDKNEIEAKFARIEERLTAYLARIRPQWEAQQAAKEVASIEALLEQQMRHGSEQVNWLFHQRLCEATLADVAVVNEAVRGVEATYAQLMRLTPNGSTAKKAESVLQQLNSKLEGFSMQQQFAQKLVAVVQQGESLVADIATQDNQASEEAGEANAQKETAQQTFSTLNDKYQTLSNELISVPRELSERWKKVGKAMTQQQTAEKAEQSSQLRQCRKQINMIENLIEQGRFRGAMAKFDKLSKVFEGLEKSQQDSLTKRFTNLAQEIARLEGWQSYIAAPRQPALVDEAKALADAPLDDVKVRTDAIRYLRQQWLSLGNKASDESLQTAFDEALERAFSPCREHYAKMDAMREEAKQYRESLVNQAQDIDLNQDQGKLAKVVDRLSKAWHQAGQVEKQDYEQLKRAWKTALAPAQEKVQAWNMANKQEKQALVDEAVRLSEAEDMTAAAENAQALQKQWKAIGHAGKRDESRLWRAFKDANDSLFDKLKVQRKAKSNELEQQAQALMAELEALDPNSDELTLMRAVDEVEQGARSLPGALKAKVMKKVSAVQQQGATLRDKQQQQQIKARATHLIAYLQNHADKDDSKGAAQYDAALLGKRWVSAIEQRHQVDKSRQWLTVALEAATDTPSPDTDSSLRTDVQLSMMTAKLEQGESINASDLLEDWIALGTIANSEASLLARVINVIEAQPELLN